MCIYYLEPIIIFCLAHDDLMVDWNGRRREKHVLLWLLVAKILDE